MATIENVISSLNNIGIFQFFLPFIILFAVVYGILNKSKIFGDPEKDKGVNRINAIISFASAAFVMLYPTTSLAIIDLSSFLANMFAGTLIYAVTIIAFMIVMFMIATPLNKGQQPDFSRPVLVGGVVAVVLIIALFLSSGGAQIFPGISYTGGGFGPLFVGSIDPSVIALILVLAIMIIAVFWITK
jgi:hypothetical protein